MKKLFFKGFFVGLLLGAAGWGCYWFVPSFVDRNYDQRSLSRLKNKAESLRNEFASILENHRRLGARAKMAPPFKNPERLFQFFKTLGLRPEVEGIAALTREGRLFLWLGRTFDAGEDLNPEDLPSFTKSEAPFIIQKKASTFLASAFSLPEGGTIVLTKLLAFIPKFQSAFLKETRILRSKRGQDFKIDFWSLRDDVSGFERIFSKHDDLFIGQPRQQNEIQTLYFPLRGPDRRILATVTLSSPSLAEREAALRKDILLAIHGVLIAGVILLLAGLVASASFLRKRSLPVSALVIVSILGLRLLFLSMTGLLGPRPPRIFSPSEAGFFSIGSLTRSPGDIFLTALALAALVGVFIVCIRRFFRSGTASVSLGKACLLDAGTVLAAVGCLVLFHEYVRRLVQHSNIVLLRFSLSPSFICLHLSLFIFLAAMLAVLFSVLRIASVRSRGLVRPFVLALVLIAACGTITGWPLLLTSVLAAIVILGIILARVPAPRQIRRSAFFLAFLLSVLYLHQNLEFASSLRTRFLMQTFLRNSIQNQDTWGLFLVRQSLPEIDKRRDALLTFLKEPGSPDFAHDVLWENMLVAKFNWYSSLEVLDAGGNLLSRFSLNIPNRMDEEPLGAKNPSWSVSKKTFSSPGSQREGLVAVKDWYDDAGAYRGRTRLLLSLDADTLPFLYSANPYFEVLRAAPIPSLNSVDFGLAIYDRTGRLVFNPHGIRTGLPISILDSARAGGEAFWSVIKNQDRDLNAFVFPYGNRIAVLFTPRKNPRSLIVEFLKLFFLASAFLLAFACMILAATGKNPLRNVFWSFSNRVYAAFFAFAMVPILLFTFFTRDLFDRAFARRFIEEAAVHATFARSFMEDFMLPGEGGRQEFSAPSDDLVLRASMALANDINLYRDARLLSSSRREFFDAGILPELLDGEIHYRLTVERAPFLAQQLRIGEYSFQTITIPFGGSGSQYFISMPLPFEKQEAARATGELVEFMIFLLVFFLLLVLLFGRGIRATIVVPVRKLLGSIREVSLGNLDTHVEHSSRDEMKVLVDGFNAMIDDLKTQRQDLANMGKKVAWAEMARKVAHEIKNPLTPIQLSAEHILKVYEDGSGDFEKTLRESISYISGEVENLRNISQDFMEIARDTTLRKEPCDLRSILKDTIDPYKRLLSPRIRFVEVYEGDDFAFQGDPAKLKIAFRNIFANATEAIRNQGEIAICLRKSEDGLTFSLRDTGVGMDKPVLDRIFEPYFSTKDAGTGLGLPIAKKIIEDHGGTLRVASASDAGTTVFIDFPVVP